MLQDRKLHIDVYVIGQESATGQYSAQVAFIQTSSNPPTPNIVDCKTGNLKLPKLDYVEGFTNAFDITFTLRPSMFDQMGQPVPATWAPKLGDSISVKGPNGKPAQNMVASFINNIKILLDNQNNDEGKKAPERTYAYTLGFIVIVPGIAGPHGGYYITIDPKIENSGGPHPR